MNILESFKHITHFVFDVDGVLTDGSLLILENGEQVRRMSIKDGFALQLAVKKGYKVIVISGGQSEAVRRRLKILGIAEVFLQVADKKELLLRYIEEKNIPWQQVLFMGDDMPDYSSMLLAGLSCAPADASTEIKQIAKYISPCKGGEGCVRDVIEKVLKLNDHWIMDAGVASK